jgi:uncharacterized protein (TIGR03086 family)
MEGNEQLAVIIPMLQKVAVGITDEQLAGSTPCTEFTVLDVLGHMTGLASGFAPMFLGQAPESSPAAPANGTGPVDDFNQAMDGLLGAVQSEGALERTIQTPGGPMAGTVFARLVALDGLVHGWDLATSTQQDWTPPEGLVTEVDAFARQAISPEMREGDAFGAEQPAPADASAMDRLAAFTGRVV